MQYVAFTLQMMSNCRFFHFKSTVVNIYIEQVAGAGVAATMVPQCDLAGRVAGESYVGSAAMMDDPHPDSLVAGAGVAATMVPQCDLAGRVAGESYVGSAAMMDDPHPDSLRCINKAVSLWEKSAESNFSVGYLYRQIR